MIGHITKRTYLSSKTHKQTVDHTVYYTNGRRRYYYTNDNLPMTVVQFMLDRTPETRYVDDYSKTELYK